jgi:hypothetical protein
MPESPKPQEQLVVTHQAILISLTEAHKQQMQRCLERSGEVKFTFKEISITRLPAILDNGVAVD